MAELTYLEAINAALHDEMEADPRVFCLGEDVGRQGGAFGATKGLQQRFGVMRTIDTPVGRDGKVVLRPMATFTLSSDHRIVDGVTAARFIADLRAAIEQPEGLS